MPKGSSRAIVLCISALAALAGRAGAAEAAKEFTDRYPAAYFASESVANAYDMVQRVPGFVLVEADEDARGYAASLGNLLVDGARPASKRESAADVLKRIPAGTVDCIELLRTGATGIDLAGFPVVANVVRRRSATTEAALESGALAATDGWAAVPLEFEYGRRDGERGLELALSIDPELDDDTGTGHILTDDGSGGEPDRESLDTTTVKEKGQATAAWRQPLAGGRLSLAAALRREDERVDTARRPISGAAEDGSLTDEDGTTRETEFGARYERVLRKDTTAEFMASLRRDRLEQLETSREGESLEEFDERTESGEDIWRAEVKHDSGARTAWNASVESTRNTLESDSRLSEDGVPVAVPGSDVRISESRREAAVGFTSKLTDALSLEGALRQEWSTITQSGDSPLARDFSYPKPRLALRWAAGGDDDLRASLSREVSQLDFEDFVASASLDTDVITAGNAALEPEKSWQLALEWEHRFSDSSAMTLGWTHERIEDVVDRILVTTSDDVFDAPGNIGDGRRDTLALQFSMALEALGIPGGRLRGALQFRDSAVTDPVTGETRGISEEKPVEGEVEFMQELPAWRGRWGVLVEHIAERETKYRFDEVERESEGAGWTLYAERRLGENWRIHAEVTDLFGRGFVQVRDSFAGPRSQAPLDERETRHRTTPGLFALTLRRSFGG
jgi:hypothetical protein